MTVKFFGDFGCKIFWSPLYSNFKNFAIWKFLQKKNIYKNGGWGSPAIYRGNIKKLKILILKFILVWWSNLISSLWTELNHVRETCNLRRVPLDHGPFNLYERCFKENVLKHPQIYTVSWVSYKTKQNEDKLIPIHAELETS